jgi:TonB family protein
MSSKAENELRQKSSLGMEWGIVTGLAILLVFFELVPASEIGRLSTRTSDSEMEAVEADIAFDDTVEEQEEEVEEEMEEIEQETEELVEELQTDITISLSEDTTGLATAETVAQTEELGDVQESDGTGPPRFMPVEVAPICTYRPTPEYPEMAAQAGVEGVVTLWVYVRTDGSVADVQLYNSSGLSSLDDAALSAAWNTRWTPAQNNGIAVGVWTTLQYSFVLTD